MSLEVLTNKEKSAIRSKLQELNAKYGSGGEIIKVNYAKSTVKIDGGKTPERTFALAAGVRPNTFKVKFAGQQSVGKFAASRAKTTTSASLSTLSVEDYSSAV